MYTYIYICLGFIHSYLVWKGVLVAISFSFFFFFFPCSGYPAWMQLICRTAVLGAHILYHHCLLIWCDQALSIKGCWKGARNSQVLNKKLQSRQVLPRKSRFIGFLAVNELINPVSHHHYLESVLQGCLCLWFPLLCSRSTLFLNHIIVAELMVLTVWEGVPSLAGWSPESSFKSSFPMPFSESLPPSPVVTKSVWAICRCVHVWNVLFCTSILFSHWGNQGGCSENALQLLY